MTALCDRVDYFHRTGCGTFPGCLIQLSPSREGTHQDGSCRGAAYPGALVLFTKEKQEGRGVGDQVRAARVCEVRLTAKHRPSPEYWQRAGPMEGGTCRGLPMACKRRVHGNRKRKSQSSGAIARRELGNCYTPT